MQAAKRILKKIHSPRQLSYSPKKWRSKLRPWTLKEKQSLVQFIALFHDEIPNEKVWPSFGSAYTYWQKASQYIHESAKTELRSGTAVRLEVFRNLAPKYKTLGEAENDLGLGVEEYLDGSAEEHCSPQSKAELQDVSELLLEKFKLMTQEQIKKVILFGLGCLHNNNLQSLVSIAISQLQNCQRFLKQLIYKLFQMLDSDAGKAVVDELFLKVASTDGIDSNPGNFASLSIKAMKRLQEEKKNNLIYKYSQAIATDRPDRRSPLMPLNRMPFGMIEYCIEFFTCTNVMQIKEPNDYKLWHETMATEFPGRFQKLFAGPMWSGLNKSDVRDPLKARTNIPCTSKSTQHRIDKKSPFHSTTAVQIAALDQLKSANPKGRFWIKIDGTDVKTALMESVRKVWNGDEDLGDGELKKQRDEYEKRLEKLGELKDAKNKEILMKDLTGMIATVKEDVAFLNKGFADAIEVYQHKFNTPNTAEKALKDANWNVVEYQNLLQEAQNLQSIYEESVVTLSCSTQPTQQFKTTRATMKDQHGKVELYLRNLFKKKRIAADHVEVVMVSDEKRNKKPYALPVKFVPCRTLKDQYLRDLTRDLKLRLTQRGLAVVGTTTDGEYCTLRTRGETRVHDRVSKG
ncbi:uncharacterized protein LOC114574477 [Exaiptasia diaphana]|uniref:Uncharacterized protein n=1 Tax=Exaiptasia diaphana TaxID=2652724 RepID=A0A913YDB7_EXADI|nr:uncharacterized protein LOC114574477 [Exaiptasia diaphana]